MINSKCNLIMTFSIAHKMKELREIHGMARRWVKALGVQISPPEFDPWSPLERKNQLPKAVF